MPRSTNDPPRSKQPVSQACLACRAIKARCDGNKPVCARCNRLDKECVYVKSMRGGARVPKSATQLNHLLASLDGLLQPPKGSPHTPSEAYGTPPGAHQMDQATIGDVVQGYYRHLYAPFPLLPVEGDSAFYINTLGPSTPLKPAIQSMLALIPSLITEPAGTSAYYASRASHAIDTTLADGPPSLDVIQSIYLLSVWEWAQNGKPSKSRTLAVQALQLCMEMGLHRLDQGALAFSIDTTWYKDSCRRTWWACFTLHTMLSILATTDPMIELSDQRLCTAYPVTSPDGRGWKEYVEAINRCAIVTHQLGQVQSHQNQSDADFEASVRRLQRLDQDMQHILAIEPSRQSGNDGANTLDFTARLGLSTSIIHLHRQQAFSNIAVFSRDTCGLQRAMPAGDHGPSSGAASGSLEESSVEAMELFDSFIDTGELEGEGESTANDLALGNGAGSSSSALAIKRSGQLSQAFAPAVSMQRCAMAASDVAQTFTHLRQQATSSVVISPLCACGLATAVYADILFALMVYSNQPADAGIILQGKIGEIASIQQALREAGSIWSTVRVIADEVQAALDALIGIISAGDAGLAVAAG